jgi:hypothetical protein
VDPFEVIVATATTSPKEEGNEDRAISFALGPEAGVPGAGVVICDGVGALEGSAHAAEWAARRAADHVVENGVRGGVWSLPDIWQDERPEESGGATTLVLLAAEASGVVAHVLIGNGSVLEVVPSRLPNDGVRLLWTDVALPQIDWREGKPALNSVLPAQEGGLLASRGAHLVDGERLFVLCSDGISTLEERPSATAPDDTVWREVPLGLSRILESLTELWADLLVLPAELAGKVLQEGVEEVLSGLLVEPGLDDDASLGVVLVRPAGASGADREQGEESARHA